MGTPIRHQDDGTADYDRDVPSLSDLLPAQRTSPADEAWDAAIDALLANRGAP